MISERLSHFLISWQEVAPVPPADLPFAHLDISVLTEFQSAVTEFPARHLISSHFLKSIKISLLCLPQVPVIEKNQTSQYAVCIRWT